jgi:hypothetical protein
LKKHTISELNELYKESMRCDEEVFSEQRSNLLLVSGNHWNKKVSQFWSRIRESRQLTNEQKLRITKNHIYKISKIRKNLLLTHSPGVRIFPANESELTDQKAAELNQSVWEFGKRQQNMRQKTQQFASDYFDVGEVACKVWWNPNGGPFKGYGQAVDPETGENLFQSPEGEPTTESQTVHTDPMTGMVMGQTPHEPLPDKENPIFEGQLEVERFYAFNLLRDPDAKTMNESPYLTYRKMVKVDILKEMIPEEDDRQKMLTNSKDETYLIFDENKQGYKKEKNITTYRETYFRPCKQYPMGYYYHFVEGGILFEGELPFGIFPIEYEGHDEVPTQARHRSPLKQARPYQIELNRSASSQSEAQVTNGQDKILMQAGAKLTPGEFLPGVRAYHITGRDPVVLEGRTGEQWANYQMATISEMYQVMMLDEESQEKDAAGGDAWAQLYRNMKQKKKFAMDAEKFEGFLSRVCNLYLDLARHYFPDDMLIPAIGKSEAINISEFRATEKLSYRIKAEPMGDDLESVMGKMLSINHILQYNSGQLEREDIGKLIRMLPFANEEKSFDDFTLDYDRATNMILALDRGEAPQPLSTDKGPYMIKRLSNRTAMSDFQFLPPAVQSNYQNMLKLYDQLEAEKARQLKAMQADFIDTSGPMIKVGWYVKDPTNPSRSIQATLPANAIQWLVQRLQDQQGYTDEAAKLNSGAQSDIAGIYNQGNQQQQQQSASPAPSGVGLPTNRGFLQ